MVRKPQEPGNQAHGRAGDRPPPPTLPHGRPREPLVRSAAGSTPRGAARDLSWGFLIAECLSVDDTETGQVLRNYSNITPSLIADCPSTSLHTFYNSDVAARFVLLYEVGTGRLRMGSEGRCCDLSGALSGEQTRRTLCAVIRISSSRNAVPRRGTFFDQSQTPMPARRPPPVPS